MKIKIEWDESRDRYTGKYLGFELAHDTSYVIVSGGEPIGRIEKVRVGAWMHWCILLEEDCYLSPSCVDECREVQRILGSQKNGGETMNKMEIRCLNCDEITKSNDGFCEHCGYQIIGPNR